MERLMEKAEKAEKAGNTEEREHIESAFAAEQEALDFALSERLAPVDLSSLEEELSRTATKRDRMKMYDSVPVCPNCHGRYGENKKLLAEAEGVEGLARKVKKRERRAEKEMTVKAAVDARVRGGRGAVGLDGFLQNAKSRLMGGSGEGGGEMSTGNLDDIEGRLASQGRIEKGGLEGGEERRREQEEVEEEVKEIRKETGEEEDEEKAIEQMEQMEQMEQRVEDTFDGYNPTFSINVDAIMAGLSSEMDSIRIGGASPSSARRPGEKERGRRKDPPRFRPTSEIAVDEHQFWASEGYKEELVSEIREDLSRGLRVRLKCEAVALESEMKSMMHSVFHEDEVKRNAGGGGGEEGEEEEAAKAKRGFMKVPKLTFTVLDEEEGRRRVEMTLHPRD